jgi:hypothetical protein
MSHKPESRPFHLVNAGMLGAAGVLAALLAAPSPDARAQNLSDPSNRATGEAVRDSRERTQRAIEQRGERRREEQQQLKDDRVEGRGPHVQSPRHGDEDPANPPR